VTSTTMTLRRKGMALGLGQVPTVAGATGISFSVLTLQPQIVEACIAVNSHLGISDLIPMRNPSQLRDPIDVRGWTVLFVLARAYRDAARSAGDKTRDHFAAQADIYQRDADWYQSQTSVYWWLDNQGVPVESNPFSTRIVR